MNEETEILRRVENNIIALGHVLNLPVQQSANTNPDIQLTHDDLVVFINYLCNYRARHHVPSEILQQYPQWIRLLHESTPNPYRYSLPKPKSKAVRSVEFNTAIHDPCCICLETYTLGDAITTCCGHQFCSSCYDSMHQKALTTHSLLKCPLCRKTSPQLTSYRERKPYTRQSQSS